MSSGTSKLLPVVGLFTDIIQCYTTVILWSAIFCYIQLYSDQLCQFSTDSVFQRHTIYSLQHSNICSFFYIVPLVNTHSTSIFFLISSLTKSFIEMKVEANVWGIVGAIRHIKSLFVVVQDLWNSLMPGLCIVRKLVFWICLCYLGLYTLPDSKLNSLNTWFDNSPGL